MLIPFLAFAVSFVIAVGATLVVRFLATKFSVVDHPDEERKQHASVTPLLGGVAVFVAFVLTVLGLVFFTDELLGGYLLVKYIVAVFVAGFILILGGYLDDKYDLPPKLQFAFPVLAGIVIILSGIGVPYIRNPFGETLDLEVLKIALFTLGETPYYFVVFADIFALLWLLGMTYTTKILDGLDGLVSGFVVIASIVIFFLSMQPDVLQPETGLLALVLAGSFAGFLVFNWHPASIFLGEGGSTFAGFMLGVLSIISGAKLATALLLFSIPIIDLAFVIFERIRNKQSPFGTSDTRHIHFKLRSMGLSVRQVVLLLYSLVAVLGISALQLQGREKALFLVTFSILVIGFLFTISRKRPLDENV